MHAEDLLVNQGGDREAVEALCECFPQADVVPPLALVVETVDSIDGGALVVAAEKEEVLGVLDFVCQQQADCLQTLLAAVNIIPKEQVVRLWRKTAVLEKTEQI